jgi:uncharacterized membrane protein
VVSSTAVLLLPAGIGFVAGLRTITALAAVSWAARLGWLTLEGSHADFIGSSFEVVFQSTLALLEHVGHVAYARSHPAADRTAAFPLFMQIALGGFAGACLSISAGQPSVIGVVLGGLGAVLGAFVGYEMRRRLVNELKVNDVVVAVSGSFIAIALAYLVISRS